MVSPTVSVADQTMRLRLRGRGSERAERREQQRKRGKTEEAGAAAPGARLRPGRGTPRQARDRLCGGSRTMRAGLAPGACHAAAAGRQSPPNPRARQPGQSPWPASPRQPFPNPCPQQRTTCLPTLATSLTPADPPGLRAITVAIARNPPARDWTIRRPAHVSRTPVRPLRGGGYGTRVRARRAARRVRPGGKRRVLQQHRAGAEVRSRHLLGVVRRTRDEGAAGEAGDRRRLRRRDGRDPGARRRCAATSPAWSSPTGRSGWRRRSRARRCSWRSSACTGRRAGARTRRRG